MGQGLSDLMYPSNPKLRARVAELERDCKTFKLRFDQGKNKFTDLEDKLEAAIGAFLKQQGYASAAELEHRLRETLSGPQLAAWEDLRGRIAMSERVDDIIWIVVGAVAGAGSIAVALLAESAATAAFALGVASVIIAIVAIIGTAIGGKVRQEKLKDAVEDLCHARADVALQANRLDVVNRFLDQILVWISFLQDETLEHEVYASLFKDMEHAYNTQWPLSYTNDALARMDKSRGSWTGADPKPRTVEYSQLVTMQSVASLWKVSSDKLPKDGGRSQIEGAKSAMLNARQAVLKSGELKIKPKILVAKLP